MLGRSAACTLIGAVGLLTFATSHATLYNLAPYDFQFRNATALAATLETNALGEFTDEASIEAVLNAALYSVQMYDSEDLLASMDASNARWDLRLGFADGDSAARLVIEESQITLSFLTLELSEGRLLLMRDWAVGSPFNLQYAQANNVSDSNFAHLDYNAIHQAVSYPGYAATFIFPAMKPPTSVPEPSTFGLLLVGLIGGGLIRRRRSPRT